MNNVPRLSLRVLLLICCWQVSFAVCAEEPSRTRTSLPPLPLPAQTTPRPSADAPSYGWRPTQPMVDSPPALADEIDDLDLPPLDVELQAHGGAYLYEPGDVMRERYTSQDPAPDAPLLRLPENWKEPQPLFAEPLDFLGPGMVGWSPEWKWWGDNPNHWEPRFLIHGSYEAFGVLLDQGGTQTNGIGHQLLLDLDYRLTGTERFHVQFRPFGEDNSGGSLWQLNAPDRFIDNTTGVPQRWWFEGELQSLFGPWGGDETQQWDVNFTLGRFLFRLHNGLLMNDEIVGVALGKNNLPLHTLSNLNLQLFYAFDDVDAAPADADLVGVNLQADYRNMFFEGTYAWLNRDSGPKFQSHYAAVSGTRFFGPLSVATRSMYRFQEGDIGQLQVLETNLTRVPSRKVQAVTGIEETVTYLNLFYADEDWAPISGGGFDRLRNSFSVDPLLQIAGGAPPAERYGVAVGTQLFRHHKDESWIPEFAYERQSSADVFGLGLRYQRKLSPRTFVEVRGLKNFSNRSALERDGLFSSLTVVF